MENTTDPKSSDMVVKIGTKKNIKRRKTSIVCSIPEELVFSILLCLPADVLYNVMRCVCRTWYNIIHSPAFISSHLRRSVGELVIQREFQVGSGCYIGRDKGDHEVKKLPFLVPGTVMASCNGLVLSHILKRKFSLYVANPITKQQMKLPPFYQRPQYLMRYCGFGYANSSGVYKVVSADNSRCDIITVGVDKRWRLIDISHLNSETVKAFAARPISAGGYVHWANLQLPFVLTMDLETESFLEIPCPQGIVGYVTPVAMGSSLSLMVLRNYMWNVWELTNPKNGQWEKLPDIDLTCIMRPDIYFGTPVGWLLSREVVAFAVTSPSKYWIVYNIKTGGTYSIEVHNFSLMMFCSFYKVSAHVHVNSLVPLPMTKKRSSGLTWTRKSARLRQRKKQKATLLP